MQRLKKNDEVQVLAGRNKNRRGSIVEVIDNERVLVSGANLVYKHKKLSRPGEESGILSREAPLHASNVAIFNEELGKPDRVGFRIEDGKKVRYFKSTGQTVPET